MTVSLREDREVTGQAARPRPPAELVGRSTELDLIDSLLAGPHQDVCGLLLRGDPGAGKTALRATSTGTAAEGWACSNAAPASASPCSASSYDELEVRDTG